VVASSTSVGVAAPPVAVAVIVVVPVWTRDAPITLLVASRSNQFMDREASSGAEWGRI